MTPPCWWLITRATPVTRDYTTFGISGAPPGDWWRAYANRTTDDEPWFMMESNGNGSWRAVFSTGSTARTDLYGRRIRNTLIAAGDAQEPLQALVTAFLSPGCPLHAALAAVCTEEAVSKWFGALESSPDGSPFDVEAAAAILKVLLDSGAESGKHATLAESPATDEDARVPEPEPGLYEIGATPPAASEREDAPPLGLSDRSTLTACLSLLGAAHQRKLSVRIGFVSYSKSAVEAARASAGHAPGPWPYQGWLLRGAEAGLRHVPQPQPSGPANPGPREARADGPSARASREESHPSQGTNPPGCRPPMMLGVVLLGLMVLGAILVGLGLT